MAKSSGLSFGATALILVGATALIVGATSSWFTDFSAWSSIGDSIASAVKRGSGDSSSSSASGSSATAGEDFDVAASDTATSGSVSVTITASAASFTDSGESIKVRAEVSGEALQSGLRAFSVTLGESGDASGYVTESDYIVWQDGSTYYAQETITLDNTYGPSSLIIKASTPNGVSASLEIPFEGTTIKANNGVYYTIANGEATVFSYVDSETASAVTVASSVSNSSGTYPVTSVAYKAFAGSLLSSVSLPDTITSIGMYAFNGCENLASIAIPAGMTSIGSYAFSGASALKTVDWSAAAGLTTIANYAFFNSGLTYVEIPSTVTSCGTGAFQACENLAVAYVGAGLYKGPDITVLGRSQGPAPKMASVTTTSDLKSTFRYCTALRQVFFLGPIEPDVGNGYVLNGCTALTDIYTADALDYTDDEWAKLKTSLGYTTDAKIHNGRNKW